MLGKSEVERSVCGSAWSRERAEEIYDAWLDGRPSVCEQFYKEAA